MQQINLGDISIDIIQKNIKNVHLSVYPPTGRVRISAPTRMDLEIIRVYAISKLKWIKKQKVRFNKQERETPREYISNESHYFRGKRYLLNVFEKNSSPGIVLKHNKIEMYVGLKSSRVKKKILFEEWYRTKMKESVPSLIEKWEKIINVNVNEFGIKKMKTKWGTCNAKNKRIWLNLELAKKPPQCLEYIIVHEMIHLIERNHNERFFAMINKYMPQWRLYREQLNRLPINN